MEKPHIIYNSLGDVYEVYEVVASRPNLLPALARLLFKHKLDKLYDIRLNHKHFDITEGEKVVGFTGRDFELSVVCTKGVIPVDMLSVEGIIPVFDGVVMPREFLLKNGVAIPYEFTYSSSEEVPTLDTEFLSDWCKILQEEDVEGLLGLSLRDDNVPMNAHGVSDPERRINKLIFGDPDPIEEGTSLVSTTWRVGEVDSILEAKRCRWCNKIRRHGKHCGKV